MSEPDPIIDAESIVTTEALWASLDPVLRWRYYQARPSPLTAAERQVRAWWVTMPAPMRDQITVTGISLCGMLLSLIVARLLHEEP